MIALCSSSVHSADPQEDLVMKTFEIMFEMSGLPSKVMQPVLAPLVQFSMEVRGTPCSSPREVAETATTLVL